MTAILVGGPKNGHVLDSFPLNNPPTYADMVILVPAGEYRVLVSTLDSMEPLEDISLRTTEYYLLADYDGRPARDGQGRYQYGHADLMPGRPWSRLPRSTLAVAEIAEDTRIWCNSPGCMHVADEGHDVVTGPVRCPVCRDKRSGA